jgi:hypothetical protein
MSPNLEPRRATIPLSSVDGTIYIDAVTQSSVLGSGHIEGGAKGIYVSLRELRDAVDVAISRLYPTETPEDLGYCMAGVQVVAAGISRPSAPMIVIFEVDDYDCDSPRQCVVLAGAMLDEDPRTVSDAIEVRG